MTELGAAMKCIVCSSCKLSPGLCSNSLKPLGGKLSIYPLKHIFTLLLAKVLLIGLVIVSIPACICFFNTNLFQPQEPAVPPPGGENRSVA